MASSETDATQDWLTLWQTELAGMAADPDWAARAHRCFQAFQTFAPPAVLPAADDVPRAPVGAAAANAASLDERLRAIERRLARLESARLESARLV